MVGKWGVGIEHANDMPTTRKSPLFWEGQASKVLLGSPSPPCGWKSTEGSALGRPNCIVGERAVSEPS